MRIHQPRKTAECAWFITEPTIQLVSNQPSEDVQGFQGNKTLSLEWIFAPEAHFWCCLLKLGSPGEIKEIVFAVDPAGILCVYLTH